MDRSVGKERNIAGSVTVFAALSFMLIVSVVCVLIEGSRIQGARVMVAMASNMALDSIFADYERELLDKYGVLLFDGANEGDELDKEYLSGKLRKTIENNLDMGRGLIFTGGTDFYGITIDDVSVDRAVTATDAGGLIWRKSVNDYAVWNYSAELLESMLDIEKVEKESKAVEKASELIDDCSEQISDFYGRYLSLIEHIDGIKTAGNGVNFDKLKTRAVYVKVIGAGGGMEVSQENMSIGDYRVFDVVKNNLFDVYAFRDVFLERLLSAINGKNPDIAKVKELGGVIRTFFRNLRNETVTAMGLIDDIRGTDGLIAESLGAAAEYIANLSDISSESMEGLKESLNTVKKEQEEVIQKLGNVEAMYEVLRSNLELINAVYDLCPDMAYINDNASDISSEYPVYEKYSQAFGLLVGYRTDSMELDYARVACREENRSVLGSVYEYTMNGLLGLVLPKGTKVSDKTIGNLELADMYGARIDRGEYIEDMALNIINETLFDVYLCGYFDNYVNNDGAGLLDYEQEFIMFGKSSDRENLKSAVMSIAGVRFGSNMLYLFTDAEKKQEAYNVAMTALGFTGIIALVKALEYVILMAWAIGETVVDIRCLLDGKKVPVIKSREDWRLELGSLLSGSLAVRDSEEEKGLTYGQYLGAIMLLGNSQDKAYRSMAVAEMHMISLGVDNFRLRNYIYGMDITVTYHTAGRKEQYTYKCSYTY